MHLNDSIKRGMSTDGKSGSTYGMLLIDYSLAPQFLIE